MRIIKIGKASSNDIVINGDTTVSRVHMQMFIDDEANVFVTDLNSMNGTFVNGIKISESVKLNTYDILRIGNSLVNWKEYLLDDVDAQDAYKTILDENKQDLLDSLDDINDLYNSDEHNTNDPNRRKKKKKYIWYAIAASIVFGGAYMYFNTDSQLILNEWTSKNNSELSYTFNDDGTFLKDSAGIIKKGTFVLIDGRKKKLELSFNDESLPVFIKNTSYVKSPKYSFPDFDEDKKVLDDFYGNVLEIKNNSDFDMLISSIKQEVFKDLNVNVSSYIYIIKNSYTKKASTKFDDYFYLERELWKNISSSNNKLFENFVQSKIEGDLILKPSENISVLVLSNTYTSKTYDRTGFTESAWGGADKNMVLSKSRQVIDFENQYYFKDNFANWNGTIVYGLMQADFDYSYEFVDGYLEINGELFKSN